MATKILKIIDTMNCFSWMGQAAISSLLAYKNCQRAMNASPLSNRCLIFAMRNNNDVEKNQGGFVAVASSSLALL